MQDRIVEYFENEEIVSLSDSPGSSWEEAKKKAPRLTKSWYELSQLDGVVRLEFIRDYWINALPYSPQTYAFVDRFFAGVAEVGMVGAPRGLFLTYSMKKGKTFYLGGPPLVDQEILSLQEEMDISLPDDFLQFYRIHNGFFKGGDTGIFSSGVLVEEGKRFKELRQTLKMGNQVISTESLLPFYRSFDLDVYQCFYSDWYPDGGVGNVLCSLSEGVVSDYRSKERGREYLAFPSFVEWLMFYLEETL
ncbi:MAG: SMI1/KNR4 family protein [Chlamydiia bacterium]|nr:SMI1/KNR4 family protein [Chlamydiia bacterium]